MPTENVVPKALAHRYELDLGWGVSRPIRDHFGALTGFIEIECKSCRQKERFNARTRVFSRFDHLPTCEVLKIVAGDSVIRKRKT